MIIFLGIVAALMIASTVLGVAAMMMSSNISRDEEWSEGWWSVPVRQEAVGD